MGLIFSCSPSLQLVRLVGRNDYDNKVREKMQDNINAHKNDEILVELSYESELLLKDAIK